MIGGEDMYMPLCRECHKRESALNKDNAYEGDPSLIDADHENKTGSAEKTEKVSDTPVSDATAESSGSSHNTSPTQAKTFTPGCKLS